MGMVKLIFTMEHIIKVNGKKINIMEKDFIEIMIRRFMVFSKIMNFMDTLLKQLEKKKSIVIINMEYVIRHLQIKKHFIKKKKSI